MTRTDSRTVGLAPTASRMCTCAVHCVCSPYHEKACCDDSQHCECFCHQVNGTHQCRLACSAPQAMPSGAFHRELGAIASTAPLVAWLDTAYAGGLIAQGLYDTLLRYVNVSHRLGIAPPISTVAWLDQVYTDGLITQEQYDTLLRSVSVEDAYREYEADRYEARTANYPAATPPHILAALIAAQPNS